MNEKRYGLTWAIVGLALALGACGPTGIGLASDQGIEGVALRGPMCPVQSAQNPCPDEPYQAWVNVRTLGGAPVTRFQTDADGRFRIGMGPGQYTLDPEGGDPFPTAESQNINVFRDQFTQVTINFDTGIR